MRQCFAEVLSREGVRLQAVTDIAMLTKWREDLVEELMDPRSPYALALRDRSGVQDRVDFLDRWCELIAEALSQVHRGEGRAAASCLPLPGRDANAHAKNAVLVLAALHGGGTLSLLAKDPGPLNAALDFALMPLVTHSSGR